MLKPIAMAALLATFGSAAAYAQTATPAQPPVSNQSRAGAMQADVSNLIGRNVQNMQNETIGEIESIYLGKDGKVDSVVLGVGGFLGIGEREVRVAWRDLKISDGGDKVTVNMNKDQVKALPAYRYADAKYRGNVFSDTGVQSRDRTVVNTADRTTRPTVSTVSTGDFNAEGQMSANAVIGASVKNASNDTVGTVEDAYLNKDGTIEKLVVSVGGFLGMGTKNVAVDWSDIDFGRDGKSVVLKTTWTKDSLKAMPDYKYERRVPARTAG
ncbi:MAG: PRC-barrel domain-containing protein [Enhydrobacter sp.]|nr:PRC-barrel domain-containing protein [Enhydrobacter sp.]